MSRIKLPEDYTEITYDQGESYGSGSQGEILGQVAAGVGTIVAGSLIAHRIYNGYWLWDRATARETAGMNRQERLLYAGMSRKHRAAYRYLAGKSEYDLKEFRSMGGQTQRQVWLKEKQLLIDEYNKFI